MADRDVLCLLCSCDRRLGRSGPQPCPGRSRRPHLLRRRARANNHGRQRPHRPTTRGAAAAPPASACHDQRVGAGRPRLGAGGRLGRINWGVGMGVLGLAMLAASLRPRGPPPRRVQGAATTPNTQSSRRPAPRLARPHDQGVGDGSAQRLVRRRVACGLAWQRAGTEEGE